MATNFFKEKYESSEEIRQGIQNILRSNKYTDEYKDKIRKYLDDAEIDLFSKDSTLDVSISQLSGNVTISSKQGFTGGYIEKPVYNEKELKKAIDVEVDELITPPAAQRPETVLKSKYDTKVDEYNAVLASLSELNILYDTSLSDIENLKLEVESLKQIVDSEKLLTAVANNNTDEANNRYSSLLSDFQSALEKGIEEAIERVSLSAQVQGLQAQKTVLSDQIEILNNIVKSLQGQVETQQDQLENQQEQQASSLVISGMPNQFGKTNNTGWRIPNEAITWPEDVVGGKSIRFESYGGSWVWRNGQYMDLYNLSNEGSVTFNISYEVQWGGHQFPWIGGPSSVTVPPRNGNNPGVVRIEFKKVRAINDPKGRRMDFKDNVILETSTGDRYVITANFYRKERTGGAGN